MLRLSGMLVFLFMVFPLFAKSPLPPEPEQREADVLIQELLEKEKTTEPGALGAVLRAYLKEAVTPGAKFVLYNRLIRAETESLLIRNALQAVDEKGAMFEGVDVESEKCTVFKTMFVLLKKKKSEEALLCFIEACEKALDTNNRAYAEALLALGKNNVVVMKKSPCNDAFKQIQKRYAENLKQEARLLRLKKTLDAEPENPKRNREYAEAAVQMNHPVSDVLESFVKSGVPHYRAAAEAERAAQNTPSENVANLWWTAAESAVLPEVKIALMGHAARMYERILPELAGLKLKLAQSRIELARTESTQSPRVAEHTGPLAREYVLNLAKRETMTLNLIPAGIFTMGSPDTESGRNAAYEKQHKVNLTKPFYIGKYEVTQGQYEAVTGVNPGNPVHAQNPVNQVSYQDAMNFYAKLNEKFKSKRPAGYVFRLPTDAEWEYAARAGSEEPFYNGVKHDGKSRGMDDIAVFNGDSPQKVGQKKPNAFGLYDVIGNLSEFVLDQRCEAHDRLGANDPVNFPAQVTQVIIRSNSFVDRRPTELRIARRFPYGTPQSKGKPVGFRIVLAPEIQPR